MRKLLLISNSTNFGSGYLDHCLDEILEVVGTSRLLFVPFALSDRTGYTAKVRSRLVDFGIEVEELAADRRAPGQIEAAEAIFVGGGNTFRLLKMLYDSGALAPLRERVAGGITYLGASAGTNVACPTIRTTNDMPIVEPPSLTALGLIPFQINPHYLDPAVGSTHMGETREQRIVEYLEENEGPVVGLREGAWIRVEGERAWLAGARGARIFRRGVEPEERPSGAALDDLLV